MPRAAFSTPSRSSTLSWPRAGQWWRGCAWGGAWGSWGFTPLEPGRRLGCDHALSPQGKQKYTLPLYRAMWGGSESARALALETFSATAPQLHVNVQNYVKKILGLEVAED